MNFFLLYFILPLSVCFHHLVHWLVPPVYAAVNTFQDDFSHGFDQWETARGSMSLWSIEGAKAKATINSRSTLTEIVPKNEYWNSSWQSLRYQFEYTPIQGTDRNLSFGYQNQTNWYDLHFVDNFYQLARVQNGVVTFSVFKNYILKNGKSYQMRLLLQDAHIQLFIDGQLIIDEVDWTFNHNYGKISLKATAGSITPTLVQFDNIFVAPLQSGETQLGAPLLKQTDPQWKDQEYDQGHVWSPDAPTIKRWGCSLTSITMILQYYGLNKLPDGLDLTPATLNDWLKQQADGYFDGGSLNWNAVTRLTRLINEKLGTTKLEYSRLGANLDFAKNEIAANRPVILEIPGHFLVGDGVSADHNTVFIKDPAYIYTQFDQHHTSPLSVRKFLPSFTDLSALVIAFPDHAQVSLTGEHNQTLTTIQSWKEFLQDPTITDGATSPSINYLLLTQPSDGEYHLSITGVSNNSPTSSSYPSRVQIFAYDKEGNVSDLSQPLEAQTGTQKFTLHFRPDGPSTIEAMMTFHQFRIMLNAARQIGEIKSFYAFRQMDRLAQFAEQTTTHEAMRYLQPLQNLLDFFQSSMLSETYRTLKDALLRIS
jgi:hypothetical protein